MTGREVPITVVIPSWNGWPLLKGCLESLSLQTLAPRILVVDDGSTDETAREIKHLPGVELLRNETSEGFAAAVNRGIQTCRSPYIALLNNDTETDPRWVENGVEALESERDYSFFASRMIQFHSRSYLDSAGDCYGPTGLPIKRGHGQKIDRFTSREPVLGASAGAAFYRRSLFQEIGLFDEDYRMYLEDVDLSLRARLLGHHCLYLPEAVVFHMEAASDRDIGPGRVAAPARELYSDRRVYWITRNRWQLMITYQPICNAPYLLYGWTKSFLYHLLRAGFTGAFLRGMQAGVRCSKTAFEKRRGLRNRRVLTDSELCRELKRSWRSA